MCSEALPALRKLQKMWRYNINIIKLKFDFKGNGSGYLVSKAKGEN